jgi:hypothetical protein
MIRESKSKIDLHKNCLKKKWILEKSFANSKNVKKKIR